MVIVSFLLHWLIFFSAAGLARFVLMYIKYPVTFSARDLFVLTGIIAVVSGILHAVGFMLFKEPMELLFKHLHYV